MKLALGSVTCAFTCAHSTCLSQLKHKLLWHLVAVHCTKGSGRGRDIFGNLNKSKITLGFNQNVTIVVPLLWLRVTWNRRSHYEVPMSLFTPPKPY